MQWGKIVFDWEVRRAQIVTLYGEGYTERDIAAKLRCSKTAVHNAIIKSSVDSTFRDRKTSGRPPKTTPREDRPLRRTVMSSCKKIRAISRLKGTAISSSSISTEEITGRHESHTRHKWWRKKRLDIARRARSCRGLYFIPPNTAMSRPKYVESLQEKPTLYMHVHNCTMFKQDGALCHRWKAATEFLKKNKISVLECPGNSPDLNPIENIWTIMNDKVPYKQPPSAENLRQEVNDVWVTEITQ